MSLLNTLQKLNFRIDGRRYYRLITNGYNVGFVDSQIIHELPQDIFAIDEGSQRVSVIFKPNEKTHIETVVNSFFWDYFQRNGIKGWRNELFSVSQSYAYGSQIHFLIERAALSYLGITGYGVHVNGFVKRSDGYFLWIAKRSRNKPTSPGKLDLIAAGGVPHGISLMENLIKECFEEAHIPRHIAKRALPVSSASYAYDLPIGIRPDVTFSYDLCLPDDFRPQVNDNEVESFKLMHISDALQCIETTDKFKTNSAASIIDFAIRHGVITPEHCDYVAMQQEMNKSIQFDYPTLRLSK